MPRPATPFAARYKMVGHTATIGDVVFQPSSPHVLISVADDGCVITWVHGAGAGAGAGRGGRTPSSSMGLVLRYTLWV